MEKTYIYEILLQRGYDIHSAKLVSQDLESVQSPLREYYKAWLSDKTSMKDFEYEGYSILSLMQQRNMTYPAALLTMDWLIKEPEKAVRSLKRGIK